MGESKLSLCAVNPTSSDQVGGADIKLTYYSASRMELTAGLRNDDFNKDVL